MCEIDKDSDTMKEVDEIAENKVNAFVQEFHKHGIGCGQKISKVAKEIHPDAIAVIPLYRSCIVIKQSDEEKKEGFATIHTYGDPHWLGRDIDIENLRSDDFHKIFHIHGLREGPEIILFDNRELKKEVKIVDK